MPSPFQRFVRVTFPQAIVYGLTILLIAVSTDFLVAYHWGHFVGHAYVVDFVVFVSVIVGCFIKSWRDQHTLAAIEAYQASDYYRQHRIRNAIQAMTGIAEMCEQMDPQHQVCCSACKAQLRSLNAAMSHAPDPKIMPLPEQRYGASSSANL